MEFTSQWILQWYWTLVASKPRSTNVFWKTIFSAVEGLYFRTWSCPSQGLNVMLQWIFKPIVNKWKEPGSFVFVIFQKDLLSVFHYFSSEKVSKHAVVFWAYYYVWSYDNEEKRVVLSIRITLYSNWCVSIQQFRWGCVVWPLSAVQALQSFFKLGFVIHLWVWRVIHYQIESVLRTLG